MGRLIILYVNFLNLEVGKMETKYEKTEYEKKVDAKVEQGKRDRVQKELNSITKDPNNLLRLQKLCFNEDPETSFKNIIKLLTNAKRKRFSFGTIISLFKQCEFDKSTGINVETFRPVFQLIYNGYEKKFDGGKSKGSSVYGPEAFAWTILKYWDPCDYYWETKRQKIKSEEFQFVAYQITTACQKNDNSALLHSNYFLGKKSSNKYKKHTGRVINKDKLSYIINILEKNQIVIEQKIGIQGKTNLRNIYSRTGLLF